MCVCTSVTSAVTSVDLGHEYDSTRKNEVDDDDSFDWFAPSGSAERLTVLNKEGLLLLLRPHIEIDSEILDKGRYVTCQPF